MKFITWFFAWLIGYYYEECDVCGRFSPILSNGQILFWCDKKKHNDR